jgi:hypothetical protein
MVITEKGFITKYSTGVTPDYKEKAFAPETLKH